MEVKSLLVRIGTDLKQMQAGFEKADGFVQQHAATFKKAGRTMTIAGAAITGVVGAIVKTASDAQETYSKFGTVFKAVSKKAELSAKNLALGYGLSTLASKDMMAATGDLLTGLGVMPGVALDISEKTQQLAVDLASFTNYSGGAKGASEALTKAMLGERESLKTLGIVITEEMVKQQLAAEGKRNLTGLAYKQAAAQATLTIAYSQSKNAVGDYNRTSGDLANLVRTLKASFEDIMVVLGTTLIPLFTDMAKKIKAVLGRVMDWIKENPKLTGTIMKITLGIGGLLAVFGPLLMILPGLVTGIGLLGGAIGALTGPFGLAVLAITAIVVALKDMQKTFREAKKEMKDFADESTVFVDAAENFKKLWIIVRKEGGETLDQFNGLMKRFGGNWDSIMKQIVHDPKFATLKALLLDIASGVKEVELEGKELSIRLPKNFSKVGTASSELGGDIEELDTSIRKLPVALGMTEIEARALKLAWANMLDVLDQEVFGEAVEVIEDGEIALELMKMETEDTGAVMKSIFAGIGLDVNLLTQEFIWGAKTIKESWEETFAKISDCAYAFIGGIDAAFAQAYENQMIRIDNEEQRTLDAIDNKYDATIEANRDLLEAEEEKTKEIFASIDADYKKKKQAIIDNVKDEEERAKMLADLETQHEQELQAARIEREQAEKETADALEDIEFAKNEALRIASEDLEEKRAKARRTAAIQEKAVALLSAIVNTAAGVTKALSTLNIPLAVLIGALGAVQIALIASKPIPLAEGGIVMKPTTALIGERGPEAVIPLNQFQPALASIGGGFKQYNYFYGDISNVGEIDEISRRLSEKTRRALERGRS